MDPTISERGYNHPLYDSLFQVGSQRELERSYTHGDLFTTAADPVATRKNTMIAQGNHIPYTLPPDMQRPDPTRFLPMARPAGIREAPDKTWVELALARRQQHTSTKDTPGPARSMRVLQRAGVDPQGIHTSDLEGGRLTPKLHLGVPVIEHTEDAISDLHDKEMEGGSTAATATAGAGASAGSKRRKGAGSSSSETEDRAAKVLAAVEALAGGALGGKKKRRATDTDENSARKRRGRLCAHIARQRGISVCEASRMIKEEGIPY
jgi:hypothetical protein